jgi:hypothetical protein
MGHRGQQPGLLKMTGPQARRHKRIRAASKYIWRSVSLNQEDQQWLISSR